MRHMGSRWLHYAALLLALPAARGQSLPAPTAVVSRADLCVTEGALEWHRGTLAVTVPKMRAYLNRAGADVAQLTFSYLGPTTTQARLGSGASRRQFGIKLRAADACNLVYVMWRLAPENRLVVSVKSNPGQHSSAQCANRGYRNIKPSSSAPLPVLAPGQSHKLTAQLRDGELLALVDGGTVWQGSAGALGAPAEGPVGLRTDNVRLEFTFATPPAAAGVSSAARCLEGREESE